MAEYMDHVLKNSEKAVAKPNVRYEIETNYTHEKNHKIKVR